MPPCSHATSAGGQSALPRACYGCVVAGRVSMCCLRLPAVCWPPHPLPLSLRQLMQPAAANPLHVDVGVQSCRPLHAPSPPFCCLCRELACLSMTPSEAVMAGNVKFTSLGLETEAGATPAVAEAAPAAAPAAGTTA